MDIELVRNHLILFLLVGHDSTSSLLTSLMFLLSQHPEVEEKMRNEVDQVMGEEPPDMQNIQNLPYTMAVIKETLRLYPPAQALVKTCVKDTTLGPYTMIEGSKVLLLTRELHRNKSLWGENAEEFDPSRFMPNSPTAPSHEHAWMPFSSGPRGCIGMQFSLIEARVILARIMQRGITFRLHKDAEVEERFRTVSFEMQCGHMHRMVPCLAFFVSNNILSLNSNFFQSL
jgi:cytochrome P450/NADPH-cytochrome P450 reductase